MPAASSGDRLTLGPLRFEVLGVSHQPQGPFRHPTPERRGSGGQVEPGGAPSQSRVLGQAGSAAVSPGSGGPRAAPQASKENVFGHFQMSGNSSRELECQNYRLGCMF